LVISYHTALVDKVVKDVVWSAVESVDDGRRSGEGVQGRVSVNVVVKDVRWSAAAAEDLGG
jgi:hypothetical protein